MTDVDMQMRILRGMRPEDEIDLFGDPNDILQLERVLREWLDRNKWHPGRWGEFHAEIRVDGRNKVVRKVKV